MSDRPPVVLVCQPLVYRKPGRYSAILEAAGLELRYPRSGGRVLTEAELTAELDSVDATIASTEPYTPAVLEKFSKLRVVSRTGVGYDSVNVPAATQRGVAVGFTPGANHDAVAEHVFALLLGVAKRVVPNHAEVARGSFSRAPSRALRGRTLGLIGLGRIGRAVARRAAAFGMTVIAHDPILAAAPDDAGGARLVVLDDLLAESDVISLHAVASDSTRHLISRESIARMKPGAVLINTARGTLVDEAALCEALNSGKVSAAGLDVFDREPPAGSPLLAAPNVLLSPHVAGVDEQTIEDMTTMAAQTIVDLFQGRWPAERIVNARELGTGWRWRT